MTHDIDPTHAALHAAQGAAAANQCDLDDVNARILEAFEEDVPWRVRAALYADEALLFQRQAQLAGTVAELAMRMAAGEDGPGGPATPIAS